MSSMLTFFFADSFLTTETDTESTAGSTAPRSPWSKNSKVQAASDRFVDLFKQVARRKSEEEEKP